MLEKADRGSTSEVNPGRKIPLLKSPAGGTLSAVRAAVDYGADEVYVGVRLGPPQRYATPFTPTLGLRPQAYCYTVEKVGRALEYCTRHDVKMHLALNNNFTTGMYELAQQAADEMYRIGVRAFIVSDTRFVSWLKETYTDVSLCLSIMGGTTNHLTADYYRKLGVERTTLETCFTIEEIAELVRNCPTDLEVFVHGSP